MLLAKGQWRGFVVDISHPGYPATHDHLALNAPVSSIVETSRLEGIIGASL